jgi:hydroxyethylthiazole kinase-like uncharacterized protein yjeF
MIDVWKGSSVREAERAAVTAATAAGDPDRYMRWAAHGLANAVLRHAGGLRPAAAIEAPMTTATPVAHGVAGLRVTIFVGPGGNGGDGLYAGSLLARRGAVVTAIAVTDRVHERGACALREAGGRVQRLGEIQPGRATRGIDVVIDAGFGTGARAGLPPEAAALWPGTAFVVAADAPSGINTDTGEVMGEGFTPRADLTVTFGALKAGLLLAEGRARSGTISLIRIPGLLDPRVLGEPELQVVGESEAIDSVLSPGPRDHKYSRGVLGLVAGSPDYPGAAVLAANAAVATGVGMLTAFSRGAAREVLVNHLPEAVVTDRRHPVEEHPQARKVSAWVVGPGLGEDPEDTEPVGALLGTESGTPLVVDASALALVPARAGTEVRPWILTPHAGELKALAARLDLDLPDPVAHPVDAALAASKSLGCVVLLKGSTTVVAEPRGRVLAACSAGPELAVAGSGDTLSGILGALVATHAATDPGLGTEELAMLASCAAVLHGLAGRRAAQEGGAGAAGLAPALARVLGPA